MRTFPFDELRDDDAALGNLYDAHRLVGSKSGELTPKGMQQAIDTLVERSQLGQLKWPLSVKEIGRSFEDRTIRMATIGGGSRDVLLWTQMHGDEPTHTAVVLNLLNALLAEQSLNVGDNELLEECTLHVVPMLNPDGAHRHTRRNAQGIDINRDAVDLATPEGRVLHQLVSDLKPKFGFNLHNQNAGKQVAQTGRVATVSVMAPPLDNALTVTPQMVRAKQLSLEMFAAAERNLPGHATKYEAGYMPTAFGEWVQTRGTTTVLLEAGGWPESTEGDMVRLHFVVLAAALQAITDDRVEQIDAAKYEQIPLNWMPDE